VTYRPSVKPQRALVSDSVLPRVAVGRSSAEISPPTGILPRALSPSWCSGGLNLRVLTFICSEPSAVSRACLLPFTPSVTHWSASLA